MLSQRCTSLMQPRCVFHIMDCGQVYASLDVTVVAGAVPGMSKAYVLYGKEGTLVLDLASDKLLMGLKAEGGELKEVPLEPAKIAPWRVCFTILPPYIPCANERFCRPLHLPCHTNAPDAGAHKQDPIFSAAVASKTACNPECIMCCLHQAAP